MSIAMTNLHEIFKIMIRVNLIWFEVTEAMKLYSIVWIVLHYRMNHHHCTQLLHISKRQSDLVFLNGENRVKRSGL